MYTSIVCTQRRLFCATYVYLQHIIWITLSVMKKSKSRVFFVVQLSDYGKCLYIAGVGVTPGNRGGG